jgi:polysaccharide biosynthesis/export protein
MRFSVSSKFASSTRFYRLPVSCGLTLTVLSSLVTPTLAQSLSDTVPAAPNAPTAPNAPARSSSPTAPNNPNINASPNRSLNRVQNNQRNNQQIQPGTLQPGTLQPGTLQPGATANPAPSLYTPYLLGAGDQLQITVLGFDEYTGVVVVLPDGTVTVPLAGSIPAAGRTADQLAKDVQTRLEKYLVDPIVTVSTSVLRPVTVNVAGEVHRPGSVQLRSLSEEARPEMTSREQQPAPTLTTALTEAGGITQFADLRQVQVRRANPNAQPITLNLWDSITSNSPAVNVMLQDGDSIYIPRLQAGQQLDRRLIARSSYAPETVRVRVVGQVNAPGEILVRPNSSLSGAVASAGGPTDDARLSRVLFVRLGETGQIERQQVDLRKLSDEYQIQDGDVIIVPKRGSSSFLDVAGRVLSPLNLLRGLF